MCGCVTGGLIYKQGSVLKKRFFIRRHCSQRSNRADVECGAIQATLSRESSQTSILLELGEGAAVLSGQLQFYSFPARINVCRVNENMMTGSFS